MELAEFQVWSVSPLPSSKLTRVTHALVLLGALCDPLSAEVQPPSEFIPKRVVSIDYCADQYLLKLGTASQILGVSPKSTSPFSYMREKAENFDQVRPLAEELISLKPDLVIRSFGGGVGISKFLDQHNIPVLQIGFLHSLKEIDETIMAVANALGNHVLGIDLINELHHRLTVIPTKKKKTDAMYLAAGGVTAGTGTLVHNILARGNLKNIVDTPGWSDIPLERLTSLRPGIVVHSYLDDLKTNSGAWSPARHPVTKKFLESNVGVSIPPAIISCGGWYSLDAIEVISRVQEEYKTH